MCRWSVLVDIDKGWSKIGVVVELVVAFGEKEDRKSKKKRREDKVEGCNRERSLALVSAILHQAKVCPTYAESSWPERLCFVDIVVNQHA